MSRDLYVCTAGDLATRSLASQPPDATVAETVDWLETEGFDVAPVIDWKTVSGYVYEVESGELRTPGDRIATEISERQA